MSKIKQAKSQINKEMLENQMEAPEKNNSREDIEEGLLSLLLNFPDKVDSFEENLFLKMKNREIFDAIVFANQNASSFSCETVGDFLYNRFKNDDWKKEIVRINSLKKDNSTKEDIEIYKKILHQENAKSITKKIIDNLSIEMSKNNLSVIKHAAAELSAIDLQEKKYDIEMDNAVDSSIFLLEENRKNETGFTGVKTGIETFDDITGGLQKTDLIVIAARPGVGKTSTIINFLKNNEMDSAGFISSEMPYQQLIYRLMSLVTKIEAQKFRMPKFLSNEEIIEIKRISEVMRQRKIFINHKSSISMQEISVQARKWVEEKDIKVLYVDYLQRIRYTGKGFASMPRSERVGMIAQESKELAKELGIPVVQLAQLKRGVGKNDDGKPTMDDLKDSGMIEQEADLIMYLHKEANAKKKLHESIKEEMELGFLKNRHGPVGIIPCIWTPNIMEISEKPIKIEGLPY